ncbi:hypothetical protein BT63DRAFT_443165 [Microthyrium microscopicum]|uniref:Uncharacterized protein n=1 Tax=Microthyrium microscopicum TaxID=703497 RepID=A0A6A6TZS8_9PEZI|nr:hypothetical protein BT63DRAFT_443165 [Microthyrium microscopicum]
MSLESKDTEQQPFLDYSNASSIDLPNRHIRQAEGRRSRLISHALVFAVTSLGWMIILFIATSHSAPSSASTPAPAKAPIVADIRPNITSFPTSTPEKSVSVGEPHHHMHMNHASKKPFTSDSSHNVTTNARKLTCGDGTVEEARREGCKYDILLNNWVPAICYDEKFIKDYQEDHSWEAFADRNLTQRLTSVDQMLELNYYWTSLRDHINHCAVMWKKQFLVLFEERTAFDTVITDPYHTNHCAQYLADSAYKDGSIPTKVEVGYAGCWVKE